MDATGSMCSLINKTKTTIGEMFKRAYEIIRSKGIEGEIIFL
jgi:hypothetical protein